MHTASIGPQCSTRRWPMETDTLATHTLRIVHYDMDDDPEASDLGSIHVDITLADGQRRTCEFAVPGVLGAYQVHTTSDGTTVLAVDLRDLIIVSRITTTAIAEALRYIE